MQTAANTNRILTGCSSKAELADSENVVSSSGLLRHIVARHFAQTVHSLELFANLTNELTRLAEQAYVMRDVEALDEVSDVLMALPVDAARQIGLYYRALSINRRGHRDEAEILLKTVADNAPINYRARAIQTLGANHYDNGQLDEALRFQVEALRMASDRNTRDLQTTLLARLQISVINSVNGDHKTALHGLESLSPLVNLIAKQEPFYFYAYRNEFAIEFGEFGRIAEARAALETALASPYAAAYPNWAETSQEIEAKCASATPSVVAIHRAPKADVAPRAESQRKPEPTKVLAFSCRTSDKDFFQRSVFTIPARATIALTAVSILDRMQICIGPRAPPVLS